MKKNSQKKIIPDLANLYREQIKTSIEDEHLEKCLK